MPKHHSRRASFVDRPRLVRTLLTAVLLLLFAGAVWKSQVEFVQEPGWGWLVLLALLHIGLVLAAERALVNVVTQMKPRYRLAFISSAGLSLWTALLWFSRLPGKETSSSAASGSAMLWLYLWAAMISAFLGGLLVTRLHTPLWEDNFPPAEEIRADVLRRHRVLSGVPKRQAFSKRLFDLSLSVLGLVLASPVWFFCIFLVWLEDPGPVLFVKNSVGKGGVNFKQLKLRTMLHNAEAGTGPVLSPEYDQRVLRSGRLFRKTALDELPQLINILRGEMSFVGPRPQRTVLVYEYLLSMPEYAERHKVLPGLAGLAQVAGDYYLTPRQKLRFDRLYIQRQNLGFDLKLLFLACLVAFWFRWQRGWNGRLPRGLMRLGG